MALCGVVRLESTKLSRSVPQATDTLITDWEKFREVAKADGGKTQAEMAELWEEQLSARTISRALKKIGFTRILKIKDL